MSKSRSVRPMLIALTVAGALGGASGAWASALPPVQTQGHVSYLSGGVGRHEAKAVRAAARNWPVMLEFAAKDHHARQKASLTNVSVQILDAHKNTVLNTVSNGPFVLARLRPGRYHVEATFDGKTMTRTMHVAAKGTAREVFVWPHDTEHTKG